MSFSALERWLEDEIGLDPGSIGWDEVARVASARMRHAGLAAVSQYLDHLRADPVERDEFIEAVLVPETWFFREPGALAALRTLMAAHAAGRASRPFRVLSIPCATGEEPYSVVIALVEAGTPLGTFDVDGVDISERSLAHATRATYEARALRHVPPDVRTRHFAAAGHRFTVADEIVRRVRFERGNLVHPGLLRGRAAYDAILCRNVLMYFSRAAQQRVLHSLAARLADTGVLFTGHAEGLHVVRPLFESAGMAHTFAYRKAGHGKATPASEPPARGSASRPAPGTAGAPVARARLARPTAVGRGPLVDAETPSRPGDPDESALSEIRRLADVGQLESARRRCHQFLVTRPMSAEGYFLCALIDLAAGRRADAEHALRRATYLDPRHRDALQFLAQERERQGDRREAAQLRRRAGQLAGGGRNAAPGARP